MNDGGRERGGARPAPAKRQDAAPTVATKGAPEKPFPLRGAFHAPPPHLALRQLLKVGGLTARKLAKPAALSVIAHGLHLLQGNAFVRSINATRNASVVEPGETKPNVISPVLGALGITGLELTAQYARRKAWRGAALDFRGSLRAALIDSIAHQDLTFFDDHGTGKLQSLITEDTQRIGDLVEQLPDQLIEKALTALYAGVTLVRLSPRFALAAALPLPLLMIPSMLLGPTMAQRFARAGAMRGDYSQAIESMLAGITDVKLFQAEARVADRLRMAGIAMNAATLAGFSSATAVAMLTQAIGAGSFALVAAQGGALTRSGRITGEEFARILYLYPMLLGAVGDLHGLVGTYQEAVEAAGRVNAILERQPAIVSGAARLSGEATRGTLAIEDVSFGYDADRMILRGVSFTVGRGEMVAIVGRTGSGKSTLLRLIARLYEVGGGRITLDGQDLRALDLADLRSAVALVSQETYLFEGSIRDNLRYGKEDATDAELRAALAGASASYMLERLPDGLDAQVGERGARLSGGERQRVAIARTILRGAPVLLLDEITSHLDYETEELIRRSVDAIAREMTLVVVTHRLATIRHATRIVVLDDGTVAESGTHDELLAAGGIYAGLWRLQTGAASLSLALPPQETTRKPRASRKPKSV